MSNRFPEVYDALNLLVTQKRNQLRKLPIAQLAAQPSYFAQDSKFRERKVWLVGMSRQLKDGRILVLLRGHVHPYFSTLTVFYDSFVKNLDETWGFPDEDLANIVEALQHECDQRAPLV